MSQDPNTELKEQVERLRRELEIERAERRLDVVRQENMIYSQAGGRREPGAWMAWVPAIFCMAMGFVMMFTGAAKGIPQVGAVIGVVMIVLGILVGVIGGAYYSKKAANIRAAEERCAEERAEASKTSDQQFDKWRAE